MSIPTTYERPVQRDPKTGLLGQYPAYEGWAPQARTFSSWWIVLGAALAVLAAIGAGL